MTKAEKERLSSLVTQRLIAALEEENPSAAMVEKAIAWLTKIEAGDVKTSAGEEEKEAERNKAALEKVPFPVAPAPESLDGLPFTKKAEKASLRDGGGTKPVPFPTNDTGRSLGFVIDHQ